MWQFHLSGGGAAFLLVDATVMIAGVKGIKTIPFNDLFQEKIRLAKGEFLVQAIVDSSYLQLPLNPVSCWQ